RARTSTKTPKRRAAWTSRCSIHPRHSGPRAGPAPGPWPSQPARSRTSPMPITRRAAPGTRLSGSGASASGPSPAPCGLRQASAMTPMDTRKPAHPLLVEQVEVGGVAERPARPDHLVERRALLLEAGLQVGEALAGVLLDPARDDPLALPVDRPDGRHVDHPAGLDRLAEAHLDHGRVGERGRILDPEATLLDLDRLLRILGRDAVLALRQLDAVPCELGHERRPDAGRGELADDLAVLHAALLP